MREYFFLIKICVKTVRFSEFRNRKFMYVAKSS